MTTNYWVLADTHFGHNFLEGHYGWPKDFAERTLKAVSNIVQPGDVLIHLGDVCFYNEAYWHNLLRASHSGKQWLIKGNHDKKSYSWYLDHGWDVICEEMRMTLFGKDILLTHTPATQYHFAYNVHGHLHQKEPKFMYQKLVATENTWRPISLRKLIESPLQVF